MGAEVDVMSFASFYVMVVRWEKREDAMRKNTVKPSN